MSAAFKVLTIGFGLVLWSQAASAQDYKTSFVPGRVISNLARVPEMTGRLEFETNRIHLDDIAWWRNQGTWSYEQALGYLAGSKLVDITQCARVKVSSPLPPGFEAFGMTNQFVGLWSFTNRAGELYCAGADFEPLIAANLHSKFVVSDGLRPELQALKAIFVDREPPTNQLWNLDRPHVFIYGGVWRDSSVVDPSVIVHHVVCGLWLGLTNEVADILSSARFRYCFTNSLAPYMHSYAVGTWELGLTNLHAGHPMAEVRDIWSEHYRVFGTNITPEIGEYVATLGQQADEFQRLSATTVEDPNSLPVGERANYYIARLSMARRVPNRMGFGGIGSFKVGSPATELVQLGWDALPALVEHLDDRRLTHVVGDQYTKVVLVQDLVLDCIEEIVGVRFRTFQGLRDTRFSVLSQTNRAQLAGKVRQLMDESGSRVRPDAILAFAENKPVMMRLKILEDMQRRYPEDVDALAYLRRWADEAGPGDASVLASKLAQLGDFSKMRAIFQKGDLTVARYLADFGAPEDYVLVRQCLQEQISAKQFQSIEFLVQPMARIGLGYETNPHTTVACSLPILLDTVQCRELRTPGRSVADFAFEALLKLTGRRSKYAYERDEVALRSEDMDEWLAWWKQEGRETFLKQHPEVEKYFWQFGTRDCATARRQIVSHKTCPPRPPHFTVLFNGVNP